MLWQRWEFALSDKLQVGILSHRLNYLLIFFKDFTVCQKFKCNTVITNVNIHIACVKTKSMFIKIFNKSTPNNENSTKKTQDHDFMTS